MRRLAQVLPYVEQAAAWNEFAGGGNLRLSATGNPSGARADAKIDPYKANPWEWDIARRYIGMPGKIRPSDPSGSDSAAQRFPGRTNYRAGLGDSAIASCYFGPDGKKSRGPFCVDNGSDYRSFASISDGTSNTAMFAEVPTHATTGGSDDKTLNVKTGILTGKNPQWASTCVGFQDPNDVNSFVSSVVTRPWLGRRWCDGMYIYSGVNTILPPNSVHCIYSTSDAERSIVSAASYRSGGVNVCMSDGSVRFVSETIDCGDASANNDDPRDRGGKSPYGVWGAIGAANAGETDITL